VQDQGYGRPPGAGPGQPPRVVLRGRNTAVVAIFGGLALLFALVLVVSETSQQTTGGRIAAAVFFGALLLGALAGTIAGVRRTSRIEIRRDAIVSYPLLRQPADSRSAGKPPPVPPVTFGRHEGGLRLLPAFTFYSRTRKPKLIFLGTGGFIVLNGYSPARVRRACEAQGWRFDGNPALAVRDVQNWLHSGLSFDAVQLLRMFGPFPGVAADNEPHTSLEAAVFEDIGDKFARSSRGSARGAYGQAATVQRAFAGYAAAPGEGAARVAEAARIEGKLRG
jgi:hypothetical protein